jgi:hypothetical protein
VENFKKGKLNVKNLKITKCRKAKIKGLYIPVNDLHPLQLCWIYKIQMWRIIKVRFGASNVLDI